MQKITFVNSYKSSLVKVPCSLDKITSELGITTVHPLKPNFTEIIVVDFEAILLLLFQKKVVLSIGNLMERTYPVTHLLEFGNLVDEYTALSSKY